MSGAALVVPQYLRLVTGLGVPIVAKPFGVPDLFATLVASRSWWSNTAGLRFCVEATTAWAAALPP